MAKSVLLGLSYPLDSAVDPAVGAGVIFSATNRGNVKLPAAAGDAGFAGVVLEKKDGNGYIPIQVLGVAQMISDGSAVINPGDKVIFADTTGKIKTISTAYDGLATNVRGIIGTCVNHKQVAATSGEMVEILLGAYTQPTTA